MLKEIKKEKDVITSEDLFREIIAMVKEAGKWPDIIDYALPNHNSTGFYDYQFEPVFTLAPGGCEGYYLTLAIRGNYSLTEKFDTFHIGSIKTLAEDEEGIRKMATLYGECLIAYKKIMHDNLDSFTRKGYDLHFLDKEGKKLTFGYSGIKSIESAMKKFQTYHEKDPEIYCEAAIRNNLTREEKLYGGYDC